MSEEEDTSNKSIDDDILALILSISKDARQELLGYLTGNRSNMENVKFFSSFSWYLYYATNFCL